MKGLSSQIILFKDYKFQRRKAEEESYKKLIPTYSYLCIYSSP